MYNIDKDANLKELKRLVEKENYTDLGWSNDGIEFSQTEERRMTPIREVDCSTYSKRGTHKVYVDDDAREILHVDMSD